MNIAAPDTDWYCRRGSELLGPVSTARLEQLIAARAIQDHDHVRVGADGEWIPVADIRPLFQHATPSADAAHAARDALARAARAQLAVEASHEPHCQPRKLRFVFFGLLGDLLAATLGRAGGWLAARMVQALTCRPVRWGIGAALAGAVVWAFVWFYVWPRLPVSATKVLADYRELWDDVQDALHREATPADWDTLVARAQSLTLRHAPPLQRQAQFRRPAVQELLLATTFVAQAVHDARDGRAASSPAAAKFLIHLQNADRRLAREHEVAREHSAASAHDDDLFLTALLIVDGLLLLAGVVYILRQRRRRHAP